jgi:hypothetical protein
MPKYNPKLLDPNGRLARSTRKKTVVTNIARKHFLKTFKRMQRQKAREERSRFAGSKSRKSMRSSRPVDVSVYRKLIRKSERIGEFADFLLETRNKPTYDSLVTYVDGINTELINNLKKFNDMIGVNKDAMGNIELDDTFETLLQLSRRFNNIANDLLQQSNTHNLIKPILDDITDFIEHIYKQLEGALESFKGELKLARNIKNENSPNNSGLNAIMAKFRNLGLGN